MKGNEDGDEDEEEKKKRKRKNERKRGVLNCAPFSTFARLLFDWPPIHSITTRIGTIRFEQLNRVQKYLKADVQHEL